MSAALDITHIREFLGCDTPRAWVNWDSKA